MDYMLDLATRFLEAEREGVVFKPDFLARITTAIEKLNDDPTIWHWRDERARDLLAMVFYAKPDIAQDLTDMKASVIQDVRTAREPNLYPAFLQELLHALSAASEAKIRKIENLPKDDAERRKRLIGDPKLVANVAEKMNLAVPFSLVLDSELVEICKSRSKRLQPDYDAQAAHLLKTVYNAERSVAALTRVAQERTQCEPPSKPGDENVRTPKVSDVDQITRLEASIKEARGELQRIDDQRRSSLEKPPSSEASDAKNSGGGVSAYPLRRAQEFQLVGLALSGGGIRSATFNLGVLQAMADLDLLRKVDYLSAVSGGSYIASWLAAWCKRETNGIRDVQRWLSPLRSPDPEAKPTHPIWFLRQYSNYLTPKKGFFKADTWTLVSTWLRNTLLNQTVLILGMAALLLVPRWFFLLAQGVESTASLPPKPSTYVLVYTLAAAVFVLFLFAAYGIGTNLKTFERKPNERSPEPASAGCGPDSIGAKKSAESQTQGPIQRTILLPMMVVAVLGTILLLWWTKTYPDYEAFIFRSLDRRYWQPALISGFVVAACLWLAQIRGRYWVCFYEELGSVKRPQLRAGLLVLLYSLIGGAIGGVLVAAMLRLYYKWPFGPLQAAVFGPALLIVILSLAMVLHIGVMGINLPDERREWWSRLGAWLLIYTLGWTALAGFALYGPWLLVWAGRRVNAAGGALWLLTTAWGLWRGYSHTTPAGPISDEEPATSRTDLVTKVAPYVFIIGVVLILSFALQALLFRLTNTELHSYAAFLTDFSCFAQPGPWWLPFVLFAAAAGACTWLASRFDVNEFSMHHFYRNRLTRCYLGAARPRGERSPNLFTGFDRKDDLELKDLMSPTIDGDKSKDGYVGPYLIVNTALNLVAGKELAWQERKAASFVFTPLYCGYEYHQGSGARYESGARRGTADPRENRDGPANGDRPENGDRRSQAVQDASRCELALYGYRSTAEYAYPDGPTLGTAIAISGAAVSPNMGYHSSPPLAFLMTLFNVRLGWWMGNTRHQETCHKSSPHYGLGYLVWELIGNTNDASKYVNLSDGGHFENLGIYELVRRRCRYIIACDAEQDNGFKFGGLGNAIRKCRTDFGVEMDVDLHRVRPVKLPGKSQAHCVVGDIKYPGGFTGKLLYVKSSLTDDEPADVFEYSLREKLFPHQSTADQFFDESQFESYRALGRHLATIILERAVRATTKVSRTNMESLFEYLTSMWYPHTPAMIEAAPRHSQAYDALLDRLRDDPDLLRLDDRFFPAIPDLMPPPPGVRGEFYMAALMIQLMHSVFRDLDLESKQDHPHNEGWMRIFRRWAEKPAVNDAWSVLRSTYGLRFRKFYDDELAPKR